MQWTEEAYKGGNITLFLYLVELWKATEASYEVPLLNAKAIKPHSIGQELVKPTAKVMVNILFGRKSQQQN